MKKEFTFIDLCVLFIKKLKEIMVVSLSAACILGAVCGIIEFQKLSNEELQLEAAEAYTKEKATYLEDISNRERELKKFNTNLESVQEYMDKSIYYNMDGYHIASKEIIFYIETDYQILPDMSYQNPDKTAAIVSAYVNTYKSSEVYSIVSNAIGKDVSPRYINELITVRQAGDAIVAIKASYHDEATAAKIADGLFHHLNKQIASALGEYRPQLLSASTSIQIDESLIEFQSQKRDELEQLLVTIPQKETELEQLKQNEPREPANSKTAVLKKALLFAVLGGLVGIMFSYLFFLLIYLFNNKLRDARDLELCDGVELLGVAEDSNANQKRPLRSLAERLMGFQGSKLPMQELALLVQTAASTSQEATPCRVLVSGTIAEHTLQDVSIELANAGDNRVAYSASGCVLSCPRTPLLLSGSDCVLLVEQQGASDLNQIRRQVMRIQKSGIPILGAILLPDRP